MNKLKKATFENQETLTKESKHKQMTQIDELY